ncbi:MULTISPECIES: glutamic-type intramembrane protease PrsW [Bacillaceae]|uniref:Protease PrsW n=2 Tax=Bacillus infantis TaxID=324767 RepID=U5LFF3_9BACI|nr:MULTISPECIES: glutamic-type intramembrane protease PrsW [Bacillus]OXT19290.1 PrsW family intramembrane metalloprotease [Bacillus sp. OG2]AGX05317.1 protease [Bacillus infantis NRRL B-14911]MCA1036044.1 intramembrane metalloprotease PrsW [Bacillus infantis]MCK6204610.1 intramembrane metalloprotease PrsW [Bacillus infantis]MCP1159599.1 glutamic-type intramembrane protease PrsW [Bacillus infantis]
MLGILSAGIAPGLALLSYFYLKDEYDSEPVSMVFRTFLFGALLVFPIMFIQYVLETEQIVQSDIVSAFFSASMLEEFFKWFILFYTVYQHISFDEPYDGIVYGASVSLGFATAENILYLIANGLEYAIGRALLPVSSHALFGVIMGYYIGKGKFTAESRKKWISLSLFLPFILHGTYDFILVSQEHWKFIMVPFMIFLWWYGLRKVKMARAMSMKQIEESFDYQKTLYP